MTNLRCVGVEILAVESRDAWAQGVGDVIEDQGLSVKEELLQGNAENVDR